MNEPTARERRVWKGEIVTVTHPGKLTSDIRTANGFVYTVPTRQLKKLSADDERRLFTFEV